MCSKQRSPLVLRSNAGNERLDLKEKKQTWNTTLLIKGTDDWFLPRTLMEIRNPILLVLIEDQYSGQFHTSSVSVSGKPLHVGPKAHILHKNTFSPARLRSDS